MSGVAIAERWFSIERVSDDLTRLWEPHVAQLLQCNIWHVRGRDRDLLIDTGLGISSLLDATRDLFDKPVVAVATHSHFDHVGSFHEFDTRVAHKAEADLLEWGLEGFSLRLEDWPEEYTQSLIDSGYAIDGDLVTAYPHADFNPAKYSVEPSAPTWLVDEGDVIDTGDRAFEVMHLPGHSPGSIGLYEADTQVLFSGDAIYDGPLLDEIPGANIGDYIKTMERLLKLNVSVVHGGHDPSFDQTRLREIATTYLETRRS